MSEDFESITRISDILSGKKSKPIDVIRVLHVDDEPDQLKLTKIFLEETDPSLQITSVTSPEEALQRLQEEAYDCIVSDYKMPDMDGIEFARRVRQSSRLPFIIYTGHGSEEVAEAAFSVGIDDYMRKEFEHSHYHVLAKRVKSAVDKHTAENQLKTSLETSAGIVETIPSGLIIYKYEPPGNLVLIFANHEAERLIGFRREDWIGLEFEGIWPYDKKVGLKESYLDILKSNSTLKIDHLYWNDNNVEGYFNVRAFKIPGNKIAVAFENITERVQFEEQLRENARRLEDMVEEKTKELVEAERMLGASKITTRVLHDLKTPLQTIKNSVYILGKSSERKEKMLGIMERSIDEAVGLLDELSRTIFDTPLEVVDTDIRSLIQSVLDDSPTQENVEYETKVDGSLTFARLDVNKMRQVLDCLVKNATEAMQVGGRLTISADRFKDDLRIVISDTGAGIPEGEMHNIFKPFYTTKPMRTGLGLAFCKRVVKAHGGRINVESRAGEGTHMTIIVPLYVDSVE
jgi:signal transduction histidine kinase/FixJ family two-component response regulator